MVERTLICQECLEPMTSFVERCDYEHGCREPLTVCQDCGGGASMFTTDNLVGRFHRACLPYKWNFYDAFLVYGFDNGASRRNYTHIVHDAIEALGYMVDASKGGFENTNYITRIARISDGKDLYGGKQCQDGCNDHTCPYHLWLSVENGRTFANTLPQDICEALYELQVVITKIPGFVSISKCDFLSVEHPLGLIRSPPVRADVV